MQRHRAPDERALRARANLYHRPCQLRVRNTPGDTFIPPVVGGTGSFLNAGGEVDILVLNSTDSLDTFKLVN